MSVAVALEDLAAELRRWSPWCYLLTVASDGRPKAVACPVRWERGGLVVSAGGGTRRNVAERPSVALVWSPTEAGGMSLIVDGHAEVGEGDHVQVTPTGAVRHRPAPVPGS